MHFLMNTRINKSKRQLGYLIRIETSQVSLQYLLNQGTDAGLNPTEIFSSEPTEQKSRTFDVSETEVISQFKDQLDSKDRKLKEVIQENAMLRHYKKTPNEHMIRGYNRQG